MLPALLEAPAHAATRLLLHCWLLRLVLLVVLLVCGNKRGVVGAAAGARATSVAAPTEATALAPHRAWWRRPRAVGASRPAIRAVCVLGGSAAGKVRI
jgi:hypothetical protein